MKSNVFQLSHRIKALSKQVIPRTYITEKRVFVAAGFKDLWVVPFQTK